MAGKKLPFEAKTEVTRTRRTMVVLNEGSLERVLKDYVLNELGIIPSAGVKVGVNINTAGEAKIVVIEDFQDQPTPQADPELEPFPARGIPEVPLSFKYRKRLLEEQDPEA